MYTIYYYVYRIRYRMFCCRKMILRSLTGPVHRDPSEDVEMDEDDQRDYEDYNYQPQLPQEDDEDFKLDFRLQRLVQVLVDSMEFTADELESAAHSIQTPPVSVPDSGTSLKEAIEVHMCK